MLKYIMMLDDEQLAFIEDELGVTKGEMIAMSRDEQDDLYDKICDIEIEEVCKNSEVDTPRCAIASDIVTLLGEIYRDEEIAVGRYD